VTDHPLDFEAFFAEAEPLLRRALVAGYGGDIGREATAEALTHAWQHWDRIASMSNPTGYVYRVGERWARRHRGRGRRRAAPPAPPPPEPRFEPRLVPALAALSRRQRQVVTLVHGLGLSHAETADVLGLSRSTVQNHVERGLAALRVALGVEP
jgi:DNA-directed RNA polymerase specialized sigma24 family protein